MPSTVRYTGSFYFGSNAELEEVIRLIKETSQEADLDVEKAERKLTIDISIPIEQKDTLQAIWNKAATYATGGMILTYHDDRFEDVTCDNRIGEFSSDRPAVVMFTIQEFEESFGKLDMEISEVVYNSPCYIYDQSLKNAGPKFPDEIPISDEDCAVGFAILDKIWLEHFSQSETFLYPTVFKQLDEGEEDSYFIQSTHGFAPGYTFEEAIAQAKKKNFIVFRWDEYWNG